MNCPNCKERSVCFCKNCKSRRKFPTVRTERTIGGEYLKCPYCKSVFHIGYLEDLEYKEILEKDK